MGRTLMGRTLCNATSSGGTSTGGTCSGGGVVRLVDLSGCVRRILCRCCALRVFRRLRYSGPLLYLLSSVIATSSGGTSTGGTCSGGSHVHLVVISGSVRRVPCRYCALSAFGRLRYPWTLAHLPSNMVATSIGGTSSGGTCSGGALL
tara:strand:+ start:63 stop:506 length:444 start_codon:yes stop_codon:yes gene_type:complete